MSPERTLGLPPDTVSGLQRRVQVTGHAGRSGGFVSALADGVRPSTIHVSFLLVIAACTGGANGGDDTQCERCDLPQDPAELSCSRRRSGAFDDENRLAFNDSFLRWSCADVEGVTLDDRGQEYCEYFAITKLSNSEPAVLGKNLGADSSFGTTSSSLSLTTAQIAALEAKPTEVVGQCVFSSWNSDIPGPVPACAPGAKACPAVSGIPIDETFRMTFDVNSADAGQQLVNDCFTMAPGGDTANPRDLRNDAFTRGCLWDAAINQTEFRKSDTTVCASMTRLSECGCSVTGDASLAELISPVQSRGFRLGGWRGFVSGSEAQSSLPPNCRYVNLGDSSQTLVTCDLVASALLQSTSDVRGYCQKTYADLIVVHVPIPKANVTCDPSTSTSPYATTCSATPWVVTP